MDLKSAELFVKVIENNGFTAAADQLQISKQTISRRISELERELGVRLLERNTRYIRMTEQGKRFFDYAVQVLELTNDVCQEITQHQEEPSGKLRIAAPTIFGELHLNYVLYEYMKLYPKVSVEVEYGQKIRNPLQDGFDLIFCLGPLKDSTLIAKKILPNLRSLFASPDFIEKYGEITDPHQLSDLPCLFYREEHSDTWDMKRQEEIVSVYPKIRLQTNNFWLARRSALDGIGIATLPWVLCLSDIKKGKLVRVLSDWNHMLGDLYAVYPSRKYLSLNVRTFLNLVQDFMVISQSALSQKSPEVMERLSEMTLHSPHFFEPE